MIDDPILIGGLMVGCALLLTLIGLSVAVALGLTGLTGLWLVGGENLVVTTLETLPHEALSQYSFVIIPMFILMGVVAGYAHITNDIYDACYRFMSRVKGSLYMVTVISSAGFATISGSTVVSAAVFTRLALPQMIRYGYNTGLGAGCIAAAGTFATLIPPSIMMVIYALLTGESVGRLFLAGVIPGALTAVVYLLALWLMVKAKPDLAPTIDRSFTWAEKRESLSRIGPFVALTVLVLGGIYSGLVYPTSAGAVGAVGAIVIAYGRNMKKPGQLATCLRETIETATALFLVLLGGLIFTRYLVFSGFITDSVDAIGNSGVAPWMVLLAIIVGNLILGMFIDTISITVVTVPFVYPLIVGLGYDPIWFGILLIKLIEISAITPPVGLNLFAVQAAAPSLVKTAELYRGIVPFVVLELVLLAMLAAFPEITLWLPDMVFGKRAG